MTSLGAPIRDLCEHCARALGCAKRVRLIPVSQILFGSDFPFRPGEEAVEGLTAFRFKPRDQWAIERDNALRLVPRLKML